MRNTAWILAGAMAFFTASAFAADGDAPSSSADQIPWARWQGRLSLGTSSPAWRLGVEGNPYKLSNASVMGDYYFTRSLAGDAPNRLGGFRATSGLIMGQRGVLSTGQPNSAAGGAFSFGSRLFGSTTAPYGSEQTDAATLPYVGLGYTGLSVRNGWSFSADLGMVGNARLGRSVGSGQALDEAVHDMRVSPLLQLGVSYSF